MIKNSNTNNFWGAVWREGKYYVSQCLNVDIYSFGKTKKEAVSNIKEAVELYLEDDLQNTEVVKVEQPEVVVMPSLNYA